MTCQKDYIRIKEYILSLKTYINKIIKIHILYINSAKLFSNKKNQTFPCPKLLKSKLFLKCILCGVIIYYI